MDKTTYVDKCTLPLMVYKIGCQDHNFTKGGVYGGLGYSTKICSHISWQLTVQICLLAPRSSWFSEQIAGPIGIFTNT